MLFYWKKILTSREYYLLYMKMILVGFNQPTWCHRIGCQEFSFVVGYVQLPYFIRGIISKEHQMSVGIDGHVGDVSFPSEETAGFVHMCCEYPYIQHTEVGAVCQYQSFAVKVVSCYNKWWK